MLVWLALKLLLDYFHHLGRVAARTEDEEKIDGRETGGVRNGPSALFPHGGGPHSSRCQGHVLLDEEMAELVELLVFTISAEMSMTLTTSKMPRGVRTQNQERRKKARTPPRAAPRYLTGAGNRPLLGPTQTLEA